MYLLCREENNQKQASDVLLRPTVGGAVYSSRRGVFTWPKHGVPGKKTSFAA